MNACTRVVSTGLVSLAFVPGLAAQPCTPHWAEPFPNAPVLNGEIRALAMFDEGTGPKLFATGPFQSVGGASVKRIGRWNGAGWESVGSGLNGVGYWLGVLDVGSGPALYVGGSFSVAGTTPASNIARWDGASWSSLGAGTNGTVRGAVVFDDGSGPAIYAIGLFTEAAGLPGTAGVARYNPATGQWSSVGGGLSTGVTYWYPQAYSVGVFDLGNGPALYVGGQFVHAGNVVVNHIARWDGSAWTPVHGGVHGNDPLVMKMAMFDDGAGERLILGGRFAFTPSGEQRPRVAGLGPGGWVQIGSDLSSNTLDYVNSLAVIEGPAGSSLHVGGLFSGATWLNRVNYVARLANSDWVGLEGGMSNYVRSLIVVEESGEQMLYAGGQFFSAGSAVAHRAARWDGQRWHGLEPHRGLVGTPRAAAGFNGEVYVGGLLTSAGTRMVEGIASWNGTTWSNVGGGLDSFIAVPAALALQVYDDGTGEALYAAGRFDTAGGGPAFNIARWDGEHWSALGGNGVNDLVRAMAVYDDGSGSSLYVGGHFGLAGGASAHRIARWNGQVWSTVGSPIFIAEVRELRVLDGGSGPELYMHAVRTTPAPILHHVLKWDGVFWTLVSSGQAPITTNLQMFDDGQGPSLVAGLTGVQRWSGTAWVSLGAGQPHAPAFYLFALRTFDDGTGPALFVGGSPPGMVARQNGQWRLLGAGLAGDAAFAMTDARVQGHNSLFVAGSFTSVDGQPTAGFAEWRGCPLCPADCNGDGVLNLADFGCFQSRFALADPRADCNGDGVLNLADFGCFQTKFAIGCP